MGKLNKYDLEILEKVIRGEVSYKACPKDEVYILVHNLLFLIQESKGAKEAILRRLKELGGNKNHKVYEC